jgi:ParB family chromosome partitioning protein
MLRLLKHSEQRLVAAVERGWLSITLADQISRAGDSEVQSVMLEAYQKGLLRGEQLMKVRRLIDRRAVFGKSYRPWTRQSENKLTPDRLVQTYQIEVRRQQLTIKKAEIAEGRLLFIISALRQLLGDKKFIALLMAEGLDDISHQLAARLEREGVR